MLFPRLNHPAAVPAHLCDALAPVGDPTGTAKLRRRSKAAFNARWLKLKRQLRNALVDMNMLALGPKNSGLTMMMLTLTPDAQLKAFQRWFDNVANVLLLQDPSLYDMVDVSYRRGIRRGQRLSASTAAPGNIDTRILLYRNAAVIEMQGIVEAVSQRVMREVTLSLQSARSVQTTLNALLQAVDKVGVPRAYQLVEYAVVRAFNNATLDQFSVVGISQVGLVPETRPVKLTGDARRERLSGKPVPSASTIRRIRRREAKLERFPRVEVVTAGDNDVCPICEAIEDEGPYTINYARTLIPAHPNCRCAFVPFYSTRDAYNPDQPRDPRGTRKPGRFSGRAGMSSKELNELLFGKKEDPEPGMS